MTRYAWTGAAVLAIAATAALATGSVVRAAPAGKICPSFSKSGKTYHWTTVGTGWTCASAKPWVVKLSGERARKAADGRYPLANAPKGYHCFSSFQDKRGYAIGGACYLGTLAYPRSGFQWLGS
jgi:hypothetical protein